MKIINDRTLVDAHYPEILDIPDNDHTSKQETSGDGEDLDEAF